MRNKNIEETTRERLGEGRFTMEQEVVNAKARTFSLCHQSICNVDNQHPHHSASIRSTYCLVLVLLTNKSIKVYIPLRKREASFFGQIMKERIIETTGNIRGRRVRRRQRDNARLAAWRNNIDIIDPEHQTPRSMKKHWRLCHVGGAHDEL